MISKSEIKYIQSLSHKKQRLAEGVFIAEGVKLVDEILQSNHVINKIYATSDWIKQRPTVAQVTEVSVVELEKISNLQTPNLVVAIVEQKNDAAIVTKNNKILVLDGLQDPGNVGAIIRAADWFGIKNIVASNDTVDVYNPKVIQSTMGSFLRVNLLYTNLTDWLATQTIPVFGALLAGESVYGASIPNEAILIIGNEGNGIRPNILPFITYPVHIPKIGNAESLNAAMATGILLSHWVAK